MLNASDGDIVTLFKAFGIDVPAKIYTKGDLRELKSAIDPWRNSTSTSGRLKARG